MDHFSKEVKRLLSECGWQFKRAGKGDHDVWHDPKTGATMPVDGKIKSRHTANAILKAAGIGKKL